MLYQLIKTEIGLLPGKDSPSERSWVQKYLGSNKPTRSIKTDLLRGLAKKIATENPLSPIELTTLLDQLYSQATTCDEILFAAMFLGYYPKLISRVPLKNFEYWLSFCHGWCEVDVLCSSDVSAEVMLGNFSSWSKLLKKLSQSKNINQRRASLVLLCKPLRQSADPCLSKLALELVDKLKFEKDILITKAVSWVLRSMVKNHRSVLEDYLSHQSLTLPAIALRETRKKLETGRKS